MRTAAGYLLLCWVLVLLDFSPENVLAAVVLVRVGVVLDMSTEVGKMSLGSMNIALADFYAENPQFQTRLVLTTRDSAGDVVAAASSVVDLLENVRVTAIIGPLKSTEANFVIHIGGKAQVPIVSFTATSPSLTSIRSPYFFRTALSDSSQVDAISAIIEAFSWREVSLVYVDDEFGQGMVPFLSDALEQIDVRIPYRSGIPSSATDDQIVAELNKLMTMQTRVFIVHMTKVLGSRFFLKVQQLGMMSEEYVWIITDALANPLNTLNPDVLESMVGVLGVRPYVGKTTKLEKFRAHYKRQFRQHNGSMELTVFGLWAYDTITALAMATEQVSASIRNETFSMPNFSSNATDLKKLRVSSAGFHLIKALSNTTFQGLAGRFRLINQQLQSPPYEVVNIVGPGARIVGYWTKEGGITQELKSTGEVSTSKSKFKSIIWPGDKISPPKGWVLPVNEKKLRILVPVKHGFTEFVDVLTKIQGFSIDVFDAVIKALPYGISYEYIPFYSTNENISHTYNDMVYQVYLKNYDAAVGDITIIANRSRFVDFSLPYSEAGISMLVPYINKNNNKAWLFLKPLTWQLWLTSFFSFIAIAIVIWILEHREMKTDFKGTLHHQAGMLLWYSFSTMVFSQRENIRNNFARIIMILWFFVILILTQSYTANLASLLTVQQLQPSFTDIKTLIQTHAYVGYQKGSFMFEFLLNNNFSPSRLLPYRSIEELNELFIKGSGNGGIAAALDEIPFLKLFLSHHCSKYTITGPVYKTGGFGFAFPTGSPLVSDISKAVLNVTESDGMFLIEKKSFGDSRECSNAPLSTNDSLGLESFWALFAIVGAIAAFFVTVSVLTFLYQQRDSLHPQVSSVWCRITKLLQKFFVKSHQQVPTAPSPLGNGQPSSTNSIH